jgi:hypothetical protein
MVIIGRVAPELVPLRRPNEEKMHFFYRNHQVTLATIGTGVAACTSRPYHFIDETSIFW